MFGWFKKRAPMRRSYVSEIDQFLCELENMPGVKSDTRLSEEQKYKRIFALRNVPQTNLPNKTMWKNF